MKQHTYQNKKFIFIPFFLLYILHSWLLVSTFYPISDIFSADPIVNFDFLPILYLVESAKDLFINSGQMWGYDPFFMAGYPLAYLDNNHIILCILHIITGDFVSASIIIKLFYIFTVLSAPLVFYYFFSSYKLSSNNAILSTFLATASFWTGESSLILTGGSIPGIAIFLLILVILGIQYRFITEQTANKKVKYGIIFVLLCGIAPMLHKSAVFLIPLPVLLQIVFSNKRQFFKDLPYYIASVLSVVAFNLFWIIPVVTYLPQVTTYPEPFWQNFDILKPIKDHILAQAGFAPLVIKNMLGTAIIKNIILAAGIMGILKLKGSKTHSNIGFSNFSVAKVLIITLLSLFIFSYFGSYISSLKKLEPYRYLILFYFLMSLPAGYFLSEKINSYKKVILLLVIILLIMIFVPSLNSIHSIHPKRTSNYGYLKHVKELTHWIKNNTDNTARIMIEDSYAPFYIPDGKPPILTSVYRDTYPLGEIGYKSKREIIGGRYPFYRLKQRTASFTEGEIFNYDLHEIPDDIFKEQLDLYNIKWAVVWSEQSYNKFINKDFAELVHETGPFSIFKFNIIPSYFLEGKANITVDFNSIELTNIKSYSNKVVIKYHYINGLTSLPLAEIRKKPLKYDPSGFIEILNPPKSLKLFLK